MSDFAGVVLILVSLTMFMTFVLMLIRSDSNDKKKDSYDKGYQDAVNDIKDNLTYVNNVQDKS